MEQLYRQTIMDHYKQPRNYGKLADDDAIVLPYKNPTCGDVMILYMLLQDDCIQDIKFEGSGCSISMASCSMMTELVKRKSVREVSQLLEQFTSMIKEGAEPDEDVLEDAVSLSGVHKLRGRHNCALMGWQALQKSLEQHPVTLENHN
ncbi:Fe-S cluster assembly sulfur transfer protein SufU [Paenibacillus maysiensis]|uniref:Fe-S cluster assembly sulfur transfer protein SufU n=1 Tax=Paenibacillus maysiensis TaxID=1155954 RepID=UPI000471F007|nr:SUF system NifU family Fe-S cluster assembly protein [Paenibacillus maysiensis]